MGAPGTASYSFHLPPISTAVHSGDIGAAPPSSNLLIPSHYSWLHWRLFTVPQIFFCQEIYAPLDVLSTSACTSWCSDFILITTLDSVILKDYTNMPIFHKQVKLCHRKSWCVRDSNNTRTSLGEKFWIDKRRYSKSKCSHLNNSLG